MNDVNTNSAKISSFIKAVQNNGHIITAICQKQDIDPIEVFKKGKKIKIKEKNKGKFTAYCKGKVTSECIKRGKNSPSPTIRKRATFAANARSWNK